MTKTVAEIAAEAVRVAAGAVSDAVTVATLIETEQAFYDQENAVYRTRLISRGYGNVIIETQKPVADVFPEQIIGPSDQLLFLEGFSSEPKEGMLLRFGVQSPSGSTLEDLDGDKMIMRSQDILGAGAIYYVLAR